MIEPWIFGAIFLTGVLSGCAVTYGCYWFAYHRPMVRAMRGNIAMPDNLNPAWLDPLVTAAEIQTFLEQSLRQSKDVKEMQTDLERMFGGKLH